MPPAAGRRSPPWPAARCCCRPSFGSAGWRRPRPTRSTCCLDPRCSPWPAGCRRRSSGCGAGNGPRTGRRPGAPPAPPPPPPRAAARGGGEPWALRESVLLHELAHHVGETSGVSAGHRAPFPAVVLLLVGVALGAEAAFALQVAYGEESVEGG